LGDFVKKMTKHYTLLEIGGHIQRVVQANYTQSLWVKAELLQVSCSKGNYYLELVQKQGGEWVARANAMMWRNTAEWTERETGLNLLDIWQPGREILIKTRLDYSPRYGLSFIIEEADMQFTIGGIALQRLQTLERLKKENLLEKNQSLHLPLCPTKLAVISSSQAAGLQDFLNQIADNPYGYKFTVDFFHASVQGVSAAEEISDILNTLSKKHTEYNAVVIIRGGGSKLDLAAFDEYLICKSVAECRLPVIVGIGHETDESLVDFCANVSLKTPTAVAEFLIHRILSFESELLQAKTNIRSLLNRRIQYEQLRVSRLRELLRFYCKNYFKTQENELSLRAQKLRLLNPKLLLAKGYARVERNGKSISQASELNSGDLVKIIFSDGEREGVVSDEL
jgi:exodeoxyribonuclease VII large subunit